MSKLGHSDLTLKAYMSILTSAWPNTTQKNTYYDLLYIAGAEKICVDV